MSDEHSDLFRELGRTFSSARVHGEVTETAKRCFAAAEAYDAQRANLDRALELLSILIHGNADDVVVATAETLALLEGKV